MTSTFDEAAYLHRIGLPTAPAADVAGLRALHRAHRLAIAFENLDVVLGRPIRLDPAAVFDKLVTRRRGGYCFEHGVLFAGALDAFGLPSRPLLARVWLGAGEGVPAKTHTLRLVEVGGERWIADPGFGGSYTSPLPLADGAEATAPDGARHRLRRLEDGAWLLERHGRPELTDGRDGAADAEGWVRQYSFTEAPVVPADLDLANHWTSTAPGSRFVTTPTLSIVLPTGFASLIGRAYRRATASDATASEITSAKAYRIRAGLVFGIDLSAAEVDGLGLFAVGQAAGPPLDAGAGDPVI